MYECTCIRMEPGWKVDPPLAAGIVKIVRHAETKSPIIDAGWMLIDEHPKHRG